jgi:isopenicillin-N epimerase
MKTSTHAHHWTLDPGVDFLNHGSFGATPIAVLEAQTELRARMERQPVLFLGRELQGLLDAAREELAAFVRCPPESLAFVPNATYGVNAVVRSLDLGPGDELLVTDQEYQASRNALDFAAKSAGARVEVVRLPFPLASEDEAVEAILSRVTGKTRLVLFDHVTSQTGLVLPVERILRALDERGVDALIDAAHAPGMLDLDLSRLRPAYYTGNCHKWICAAKGAALLFVREDRQEKIHPLSISHGATWPADQRSRFWLEFDWTGTHDPTAWLTVPAAIRFMGKLLPGGWKELREKNRALVLRGRELLCQALGIDAPAPESMIGSLAAVPLPDGTGEKPTTTLYSDALQQELYEEHRIEVPVIPWPAPPRRLLRISAQIYNREEQYAKLAEAVGRIVGG